MAMQHPGCGGLWQVFRIRPHNYDFLRCARCEAIYGGPNETAKVHRLQRTLVTPRTELVVPYLGQLAEGQEVRSNGRTC